MRELYLEVRLTLIIILLLLVYFGVDRLVTYYMTHAAAQKICAKAVDENPGKPHPSAMVGLPDPEMDAILSSETYTLAQGSYFDLKMDIGGGAKSIEDGTIHRNPDVHPYVDTGSHYPFYTVPKHCAYSVGGDLWNVDLAFWFWGQRKIEWQQSAPNTIPTPKYGEAHAGHCHFTTDFNWWDQILIIGDLNQKCGPDHYAEHHHPNPPPQGERDEFGLLYREHLVR
ncbi:MAG: hypothetical protein ACPG1C_02675 [Alphaproteobacteria bacterium]